MTKTLERIALVVGVASCTFAAFAVGQKHKPVVPKVNKTVAYKDVQPILRDVCGACHKGSKPAHGLDLTTYAKTMKGDKEGKVVNAGHPEKSRLAQVLHGKPILMPPGGELPKAQIAKIEAWIKAGAKEK